MNARIRLLVLSLVVMLLAGPAAFADTWTFGLLPPSGAVSGAPGSTVGWGYTITNQSGTNWLVLSGLNAGSFQNGTPTSIFDFPILAPGQTIFISFDFLNLLGLYALTWDSNAPIGFVNSGTFVLDAEWWDGDPFGDGQFLDLADPQSANYSATASAAAVPEPSTLLLLAAGLGALYLPRRRMAGRT